MDKILLNSCKYKKSTNVNNSLTVSFSNGKRMFPIDTEIAVINDYKQYESERLSSNLVRLIVTISPFCSNVLFNNVTEVVKDEGSENVVMFNYGNENGNVSDKDFNGVYGKSKDYFSKGDITNAIRDTQLSTKLNGFKYHCGTDIFNNHYLRSLTFKTICRQDNKNNDYFNTLGDFNRNYTGSKVKIYRDINESDDTPKTDMHVYLYEEILPFKESIKKNLIEENGWLGFVNSGKMKAYSDKENGSFDDNNKYMQYFNVVNYKKPCDFVDMYPERDLFYFTPKYNSSKRRIEKNWNYCLTYPSSSTTDVPFISKETNGLKAMFFDDRARDENGTDAIMVTSVSKHGLSVGDYVNLYNGNEIVRENAEVTTVKDDYTFFVFKDGVEICNEWYFIKKEDDDEVVVEDSKKNGKRTFIMSDSKTTFIEKNDGYVFYIINKKKVNIDRNAQNISFKRVYNGNEVSYYVRIFSRLPNWRFSDTKPSVDEMYKDGSDLIYRWNSIENEFENHISKLSFAKTSYNDDVSQIVFTDNINLEGLMDNLGRPLTSIYFTIVKNNEGFREWYGKSETKIDIRKDNIEYSHCFGHNTCSFKLSRESLPNLSYNNVIAINNVDQAINKNGLNVYKINKKDRDEYNKSNQVVRLNSDEIQYGQMFKENGDISYDGDRNFYGDLCCFSKEMCDEMSIQMIDFRFNTAQRELVPSDKSFRYFNDFQYDEIVSDDYDEDGFKIASYKTNDIVCQRKEGYYYQPHYEIKIKSFSSTLEDRYPLFIPVSKVVNKKDNLYEFSTLVSFFLNKNETIVLYNKENDALVYGYVENILSNKRFDVLLYNSNGDKYNDINMSNKRDFKIFTTERTDIPSYATMLRDGSCRFMWRNVLHNGFGENPNDVVYPFTNGALYVNKEINFFLKRQDPNRYTDIYSKKFPYDYSPNIKDEVLNNNYYEEEDIKC